MKQLANILLLLLFISQLASAQTTRPITPDDLWKMKRVGSFDVSPDGGTIVFSLTKYDMENNNGDTDIWLINSDGSELRPLRNSEKSESDPLFLPDGKRISYNFGGQIWTCDLDGSGARQETDVYTGAHGAEWSTDGTKFLFLSSVYPDCASQDCNKKRDEEKNKSKVTAQVFTELMYRHWDNWRGEKRSHLFLYEKTAGKFTDLTFGSQFQTPPVDLGSGNDYAISPDGKEAAYTMNREKDLAISTNNDVFIVDLTASDRPAKKISTSLGNDNQPVYSPDGKFIVFRSMKRAGFEADKQRLALYNRSTGTTEILTDDLDISFGELVWSPDSKVIYFNAANEIYNSIYSYDLQSRKNLLLAKEVVSSNMKISPDGKTIFFKRQKSTMPYEIFAMNSDGSNIRQLTKLNSELLSKLEMNELETFWSEGAEGAKVQSYIVKPPFFEKGHKYPLIFLIHGGPQGHWTDDFHYRWNSQMFASKGYVVVAANPRGSVGYGQKFTDEISLDWGGKVYKDLMNSLDNALLKFDFIDKNNIFAAGASYGGYMIAWLEGHTERFNALVNHDGVFNTISMWGSTEELWFPEWEFGGTPWENAELYNKWSPHNYAKNFKTPMLIIHGGHDFRVPESQAFELFSTLQRMNVPSKFIYFPDESHFVLKPQNSRFWWNNVFNWFEKYKK